MVTKGMLHFPHALMFHSTCSKFNRVADMIHYGEWVVPNFVGNMASEIKECAQNTFIEGGRDEYACTLSVNGEYELKSTYNLLKISGGAVQWSRIVWFKNMIPKHSLIIWMAIRGGLKTLDRLHSWGIVEHHKWVLYKWGRETEQHLFIGCRQTRAVWADSVRKAGYKLYISNTWPDKINWVIVETPGNGVRRDVLRYS